MKTLNDLYFEGRKNLMYLEDQVKEPAEKLNELLHGCVDLKDIRLGTILKLAGEWEISVEEVLNALAVTYEVNDAHTIKLREKVKELREKRGMDYKDAAAAAGVEPYVYLLMEKGYLGFFSHHLEGVAKAMKIDPSAFYREV